MNKHAANYAPSRLTAEAADEAQRSYVKWKSRRIKAVRDSKLSRIQVYIDDPELLRVGHHLTHNHHNNNNSKYNNSQHALSNYLNN